MSIMSELHEIKLNYIKYDDIKSLSVDELDTIRIMAISELHQLDDRLATITDPYADKSSLVGARSSYQRVIGMCKNIIKSKNRADDAEQESARDKLKVANIRINELESMIKLLKSQQAKLIRIEHILN